MVLEEGKIERKKIPGTTTACNNVETVKFKFSMSWMGQKSRKRIMGVCLPGAVS